MVKQSTHNRLSESSILSQPTNALVDKLVKSSLSKGEVVLSSNLSRGTRICECAAEWLGDGLQIRFMQVRVLSLTPRCCNKILLYFNSSIMYN
jgi:hypothetical protein